MQHCLCTPDRLMHMEYAQYSYLPDKALVTESSMLEGRVGSVDDSVDDSADKNTSSQ